MSAESSASIRSTAPGRSITATHLRGEPVWAVVSDTRTTTVPAIFAPMVLGAVQFVIPRLFSSELKAEQGIIRMRNGQPSAASGPTLRVASVEIDFEGRMWEVRAGEAVLVWQSETVDQVGAAASHYRETLRRSREIDPTRSGPRKVCVLLDMYTRSVCSFVVSPDGQMLPNFFMTGLMARAEAAKIVASFRQIAFDPGLSLAEHVRIDDAGRIYGPANDLLWAPPGPVEASRVIAAYGAASGAKAAVVETEEGERPRQAQR